MSLVTKLSDIARSPGDPSIIRSGPSSRGRSDTMGKKLGWFSIGLGVAELLAPRQITRVLGMEGKEGLVRAFGVREIGHGITCLSVDETMGVWSRVAGDTLDIATLLTAYNDDNPKKHNVAGALVAVAGITILDLWTAQALSVRHNRDRGQRRDYSDRSGFPKGLAVSRGAAADFMVPEDMRAIPQAANASPADGRTSPAAAGL
jgi:hypothetical protein